MPISIATDCSGMEAPIQALQGLGVNFVHNFSCDIDKAARATIQANFPPKGEIYEDITKRDNRKLYSDIYVAGFPCQPFSLGGKQQGFQDQKGRGKIFFHVKDYISKNRPKLFMLENVRGIMGVGNGQYFRAIMKHLDMLGCYNIQHTVLNTKDHGVPHSRPRLYIVGIRKDVDTGAFAFPEPIDCPSIERFLDPRKRALAEEGEPPASQGTALRNIKICKRTLKKQGSDPEREPWLVDIDSTTPRMGWKHDVSPCITARRGDGHWVTNRGRRLNKPEMMRLQGMNPKKFLIAVTNNQLGKQLGNTMSVNVLERILVRALPAARLVPEGKLVDRWANGKAVATLEKTRGCIVQEASELSAKLVARHGSSAADKKLKRRGLVRSKSA